MLKRLSPVGVGLCCAGWALFAVSMFLPVTKIPFTGETTFGWECAKSSFTTIFASPFNGNEEWWLRMNVSGLANLLLLAAPAALFVSVGREQALRYAARAMVFGAVIAATWMSLESHYGIGFYAWATSFGLMAAGCYVSLKPQSKRQPAVAFAPQPKTREELAAEGELKDFLRL